jgi:HlyD family secretion protein
VIQLVAELETAQENYDDDQTAENEALLILTQAKLKLAEDKLTSLAPEGISLFDKASAEARIESAQSALASVQSSFDRLELKSPTNGTVVDLNLQVGQLVTAGQVIFSLVDFSQWQLETDNLTELDIPLVAPGQRVSVILDAIPDLVLDGTVTDINLRSEEKRGDVTYTVTITIEENDPRLRWGMTGAVQFPRE